MTPTQDEGRLGGKRKGREPLKRLLEIQEADEFII
jgi:hypothetical protein